MLLETTRSTFILMFVNSHPKCGGASCKCKFQRGRCNEVKFLAEGGGCGCECRKIFAPLSIHNEIKKNPRQYNGSILVLPRLRLLAFFSLSRSRPEAEPHRYSAKLGTSYWPAMQALAEPASR